jgi:undecaprenyl-diphosphatase
VRHGLALIAIIASACFVVLAFVACTGVFERFDVTVELAIHRLDSRPLEAVMTAATVVGSNVVLFPTVALVALLAFRRGRRRASMLLVASAVTVAAIIELVKAIVARERPHLFVKIAVPTDGSFPSGHAMSAVGVYGVVAAVLIALYPRAQRGVVVATIVLAIVIGLSRIYLGVHWPSDVIAGYTGGAAVLAVTVGLLRR